MTNRAVSPFPSMRLTYICAVALLLCCVGSAFPAGTEGSVRLCQVPRAANPFPQSSHDASPAKVGLALGGGAARGLAYIGVLKVLAEEGIPVAYVAGTSAGSLFGAAYCAGTSWQSMLATARTVDWLTLATPVLPSMGLLRMDKLRGILENEIGVKDFRNLAIPFAAVATDITTGEQVVLSAGPVAPAVVASCAIPGVFEPVVVDGRCLVDGGLVDNVPVDVVRKMGARIVIGVNLNSDRRHGETPRNVFEVLLYSFDLLMNRNEDPNLSDADVVVAPSLGGFSPWDLKNVDALVEAGERAMRGQVGRLKELMQSKASTIDSPGESPNSGGVK